MKKPDAEKREGIIQAAVDLFSRAHDVKRVSLEAIAREARVSPATLYNYFGNRENLVYEVIKRLVNAQVEHSRDILGSDLPFAQKIIGIMGAKLSLVGKANAEILQRLILQDKAIMPFIDRVYEAEIKPLWRQMLADGKKQGYFDPGLDEEALTVYLDALQAGFRARPELLRDFTENKAFLEQLTRLMFYGFLKKEIDLFQKEGR